MSAHDKTEIAVEVEEYLLHLKKASDLPKKYVANERKKLVANAWFECSGAGLFIESSLKSCFLQIHGIHLLDICDQPYSWVISRQTFSSLEDVFTHLKTTEPRCASLETTSTIYINHAAAAIVNTEQIKGVSVLEVDLDWEFTG